MQTFLPYESFTSSAFCLDRQRLGKQRVETVQILNAITRGGGWSNHPAVNMWRGYEASLIRYGIAICREWLARGYQDAQLLALRELADDVPYSDENPPWLGDPDFHRSHQSNLLRKNPEHYSQFGWDVPADLPYVWPRKDSQC